MNLFLLLLSSVMCKLHAQQASFRLGRNLCQSVTQVSGHLSSLLLKASEPLTSQ